jgi:magnesium chelatase subunit I
VGATYDQYFQGVNMQQIVQWFDLGGTIQVQDGSAAEEVLEKLKTIQGLMEKVGALGVKGKDEVETQVSAAEFVLEGLYAHKRIGRNEERVFTAGEKQVKRAEAGAGFRGEEPFGGGRSRRGFN